MEAITIGAVVNAVAQHYGLSLNELYGRTRARYISHPRQLAMWIARKRTGASLPQIARALHRADHTTVLHGTRAVEDRLATSRPGDPIWSDLGEIDKRLNGKAPADIEVPGYYIRSFQAHCQKVKVAPEPKPEPKPVPLKTRKCLAHGCGEAFTPEYKGQFMCNDKACRARRNRDTEDKGQTRNRYSAPMPTKREEKVYRPDSCRWIEGEPKDANYCGEPVKRGSSYCAEHHARCYYTPKKDNG